MATNFGPELSQVSDLQTSVTPKQGVTKRPVLLQGASSLFDQVSTVLKDKKEKDKQTAISKFTQQQLLIADALDQDEIKSSAHARTLMRKNLMAAIDSNPALAADFITAQSSIVSLPGAADIIKEGDEAEQLERARRRQLTEAGLISPDADDATYRKAEANARMVANATQQHQLRMQTLDEELKTQNVTEGRRKEIQAEKEQATNDYLRAAAPVEYTRAENKMKAIIDNPNMSEADKVKALDDYWNQWNANMASQFGDVSTGKSAAFAKPFEMLYNSYKLRATGEIDDAALKRESDRAIATQRAVALSDPTIARLAVTSELFGNSGMATVLVGENMGEALKATTKFLAANNSTNNMTPENPFVKDTDTRQGLKAFLGTVVAGLDSDSPTEREQALDALDVTLDSISDYEGILRKDPASAIELVNWMASPDFLRAVENNPDIAEKLPELADIFQRNYDSEVLQMVSKEFTNSKVFIENTGNVPMGAETYQGGAKVRVDTDQIVGARSTKNGVEFFANDPQNKDAVKKARELNRDLKPIINNMVKSAAHLNGSNDYQAVWEAMSGTLFSQANEFGGGDQGDELSIGDFATEEAITKLADAPAGSGGLLSIVDRKESGGSYSTLLGHSQRSGGAFAGVDITNMTLNEVMNFSSPGGEYGQWSKSHTAGSRGGSRVATPMGRFQIVGTTLRQLVKEMKLNPNTTYFDERTQNAMFAHLVRRRLAGPQTQEGKRESLRKEWEGFRNVSDAELDRAIAQFEAGDA